ncbi:MAG TPA: hypothetical protein PLG55_04790 [Methanospirillum sp.]|uniref:hypothetical protein n=1 Tax=Methanospirillum sp. TaxID=45200 RepID=UPI002B6C5D05|nr:hypothetical protein [Methanospirillum sp.]HPY60029.1 hypothetical protein [Methanospirillum sp.]
MKSSKHILIRMVQTTGLIACVMFFLITCALAAESTDTSVFTSDTGAVHFFYTPLCSSCHKVMPFIEEYARSHPDVIVQYHNIGDNPDDLLLFDSFQKLHPEEKLFVPVVFIGDRVLPGDDIIYSQLDVVVQEYLAQEKTGNFSYLPELDEPVLINSGILLLAALGEGFNPCGLLVLALLLVSLMASDSRKTIMLVGSAFILSFFTVRVLSGFAIFTVIQLPGIAHTFLIAAGVIAIIAGIFQIKDGLKKKKDALFSIPRSKKSTISKYLKMAGIPAGFIVGALTGLYGMACTVGIYISILGMMYKDMHSGIFYLLAYNFVVVLPLIAILLLVIFGLSPEKLNSWRDERKSLLRIIVGVIMLVMGIIILVQVFL